ncbi:Hint domain-containing protein [Oceaniglobus ichthyenteri]|uniref:Hint domain-containing protein n=1 Tax=Oceaniglobus ichthyenteri TaxID=2136177 RepID=UPI0013DDE7B6|nr:Hint domain-containing protein [Oceaniglobus ichthyenteri]
MTYSRHVLPGTTTDAPPTQWTVRRRAPVSPRAENRPTRRFSVQWIDRSGQFDDMVKLAPAIPLFESAFCALGRGTLIPTIDGPCAVEDLCPGMLVETSTGLAPLVWIGAMTIAPGSAAQDESPLRMFRIAADAFGLGRPMPDLLLGPGARLLNRNPSVRTSHGTDAILEPVAPMADGMSVIEITPVSTIQTYHLGFLSHRTFIANGVEVESMHPGDINPNRIDPPMMAHYLSLFPHMRQISDFGRLAFPRVGPQAQDGVFAA